jgi:hypothetical protein
MQRYQIGEYEKVVSCAVDRLLLKTYERQFDCSCSTAGDPGVSQTLEGMPSHWPYYIADSINCTTT